MAIPDTLCGACPERDSSVASLPQNDRKRRAQNDNLELLDTLLVKALKKSPYCNIISTLNVRVLIIGGN